MQTQPKHKCTTWANLKQARKVSLLKSSNRKTNSTTTIPWAIVGREKKAKQKENSSTNVIGTPSVGFALLKKSNKTKYACNTDSGHPYLIQLWTSSLLGEKKTKTHVLEPKYISRAPNTESCINY